MSITLTQDEFDMVVSVLTVLASIPIANHRHRNDDYPLVAFGDEIIRIGHVREARQVLVSLKIGQRKTPAIPSDDGPSR